MYFHDNLLKVNPQINICFLFLETVLQFLTVVQIKKITYDVTQKMKKLYRVLVHFKFLKIDFVVLSFSFNFHK